MSLDHDIIMSLEVRDANNALKASLHSGCVGLAGGIGFQVETDPDTGEVTISADVSAGAHDPYYLEKFNKLTGGGCYEAGCSSSSGALSFPDYIFSGGPYYIATINDLRPLNTERDRNFAIVGGACMQVGDFAETVCGAPDVPVLAYPDSSPASLKLFNMCTPDVDCEDYRRMFVYLEQIRQSLDGNKDNNLTTGIQLFKQYEAAIHYWNFVVMNKGFTFDMVAGLNQIALVTGYEAIVCGEYTDVAWNISITQTALPGIPTVTMTHTARSHKSSRTDLRPVVSGENPMDVLVPGTMRTRDYVLQNSVIKFTVPAGSGGDSSSGDVGVPAEFAITIEWYNTHIGTPSSLTKNITVMVAEA